MTLALAGALLLLALPTALACGGQGEAEDPREYCHDYTLHAGDDATLGAHANDKGQFLLAAGGFYVEQDVAYARLDLTSIYSIWFYQESNGRPGLQRADEMCDNTPEGEDSDVTWC